MILICHLFYYLLYCELYLLLKGHTFVHYILTSAQIFISAEVVSDIFGAKSSSASLAI